MTPMLIDNSEILTGGPAAPQAAQQQRRQKIAICVPSMDRVHADFMTALTGVVGATVTSIPVELQLINHMNSVITDARNRLVQLSREWGADWLFWLDSDLSFPPDALLRLLRHDLDIVGATYSQRAHPYSILGQFAGEPKDDLAGISLVEALMMPGGLMLMKAGVYEKIAGPWYEDTYRPGTMERIGEDIDFCFKATKAGFKIWCDLDLTDHVTHMGQVHVRTQLPGRLAGEAQNSYTPPPQTLPTAAKPPELAEAAE